MLFRYPDNPMRVSVDFIKEIDKQPSGNWLAQPKFDGWRRLAYKEDDKWKLYSKYTHGVESRSTPTPELMRELNKLSFPNGIALDMEWIGRRCTDVLRGRQFFCVFDLLFLDGEWLRDTPFKIRFQKLTDLFQSVKVPKEGHIVLSEIVDHNFYDFYQKQLTNPLSEGIILRKSKSGLIGNPNSSQTNPEWLKCKYRDI